MTLGRDDIDAVARRVVELLDDEAPRSAEPARLVDAATAARLLGVSRATVYAKADELGAIRVGDGKRARLRFDPARMIGLGKAASNGSEAQTHHRRRARRTSRPDSELLPIRGRTVSGGPLRS